MDEFRKELTELANEIAKFNQKYKVKVDIMYSNFDKVILSTRIEETQYISE